MLERKHCRAFFLDDVVPGKLPEETQYASAHRASAPTAASGLAFRGTRASMDRREQSGEPMESNICRERTFADAGRESLNQEGLRELQRAVAFAELLRARPALAEGATGAAARNYAHAWLLRAAQAALRQGRAVGQRLHA